MDLGTILGVGAGFALIVMSILTNRGQLSAFMNLPSFLMVIGGSFAAMLVGSPMGRMLGFIRYINIVMRVPNY